MHDCQILKAVLFQSVGLRGEKKEEIILAYSSNLSNKNIPSQMKKNPSELYQFKHVTECLFA